MTVLPAGAEERLNRLIFRCVCEFLVDEMRDLMVRLDRNFYRAMIYLAIGQASGGDRTRPVSVRAVAQSLHLPYETTRRHVRRLEADGLVARPGDSRIASGSDGRSAERDALEAARVRALVTLFANLKGLGLAIPLSDRRAPAMDPPGPRRICELIDGLMLRVIEGSAFAHESVLDAYLYTALMTLNAAPITNDPTLAVLYGRSDTPPPDSLRRAVPIAAVARRTGLVHETVRRRLQRQQALGRCEHVAGGYRVSMTHLQAEDVLRSGQIAVQRFLQFTQAVQLAGFDLAGAPPAEGGAPVEPG